VERGESALFLIVLVTGSAGILLARRNLRLGRGDRRGAWRLAVFIFVISLLSDGISAHHTTDLATEIRLLMMLISLELYRAAIMWVMYVAAEPHVRRVWPETMIGWNRLLMGQFRDPRVGRDVLVGLAAGLGLSCAIHTGVLAGGVVTPLQLGPYLDIDAGRAVSWLGAGLGVATLIGLVVQLELLLLVLIFRTRPLAIGVLAVATTLGLRFVLFGAAGPVVGYTLAALVGLVLLLLQVRFGSLAVIAFFFVRNLTIQVPIELLPSAPYAVWSYSIIATLLVLTAVAFHIAVGGRPILVPALLNDGAERA
jgi:eukaryotic-like serine/threonine-protein kinase